MFRLPVYYIGSPQNSDRFFALMMFSPNNDSDPFSVVPVFSSKEKAEDFIGSSDTGEGFDYALYEIGSREAISALAKEVLRADIAFMAHDPDRRLVNLFKPKTILQSIEMFRRVEELN